MIDLEQIKNEWSSLIIENESLRQKNIELTRRLATERVRNNQQKLARSYRTGYIGFVFPLMTIILYKAFDASILLCLAYALFGIIIGCWDLWYRKFVKEIDYTAVSTAQALTHASKIVIYQNRATAISIIATALLLGALFYEMFEFGDNDIAFGGIVGAIVGGIIGAKKCLNNHILARRMLAELRSIEE